jgi:hypothetical protein
MTSKTSKMKDRIVREKGADMSGSGVGVKRGRRPLVIAAAVVIGGAGVGAGLYTSGGKAQPVATAVQSAAFQSQPGSQLGFPSSWTLPSMPANPTAAQISARNQALTALREYAAALGSQAGSVPAVAQLKDFSPPQLPAGATNAQIVAFKNAGRALHAYEMAIVPPPPPTPIPMGMQYDGRQGPATLSFLNDQYTWTGYVAGKLTFVFAGGALGPTTRYRYRSKLPGEVVVEVDPDSRQVAHPTTADVSGTSTTSLYPAPAGVTELELISVNGDVANLKSTNGKTLTFNLVTHAYQVVG